MRKAVILSVALFAVIPFVNAQKIKLKSGDLSVIEGEKSFYVEYDYSDMAVGKFDREEDYVAKKVEEYNEKEPGKGDQWKESWIGDRERRFEPRFEELLNAYLENADVSVNKDNTDAKYTFIVHTFFTEPGWNIGISRADARVDMEFIIVETANHDNIVAVIESTKNPGRMVGGVDFDTGSRIAEAYAKAGKELGRYLYKEVWK